jgi:hypothetical protein
MSKKSRAKKSTPTIEVGYWMAVTLPAGTAPLRSYVGQVQAVDDHGIRLTLVDWVMETATKYDLFVPWANLASALIATPEYDETGFVQEARNWQAAMTDARKAPGEGKGEDTRTDPSVTG